MLEAYHNPDSKVHGANMGPNWVLSAPDGPHVGPINLVIRVVIYQNHLTPCATHSQNQPHALKLQCFYMIHIISGAIIFHPECCPYDKPRHISQQYPHMHCPVRLDHITLLWLNFWWPTRAVNYQYVFDFGPCATYSLNSPSCFKAPVLLHDLYHFWCYYLPSWMLSIWQAETHQ